MSKLIDENNKELTGTKDILEFQKRYYKNLYKDQINVSDVPIKDIIGENETNLNEKDQTLMEGEITFKELSTALKI